MSSWWITLATMVVASMAVAIYVAWPLLSGKAVQAPDDEETDGESMLDELLVQKDATYGAIKELEFDHAMGNLSRQDYQELVSRYEDRAVALLRAIDDTSVAEDEVEAGVAASRGRSRRASGRRESMEDAIEQQVAALRRGPQRGTGKQVARVDDEIELEIAALRAGRQSGGPAPALPTGAACPACGSPLKDVSAAFCSRCGASLGVPCPGCGELMERDDTFCSACGTHLARENGARAETTALGGTNG